MNNFSDETWYARTELLLGTENFKKLQNSHVLVVGLGGVGSHAAEHLVRSGIGQLTIVDADIVQPSNINRQIQALHNVIGKQKAYVLADRLKLINPNLKISVLTEYLNEKTIQKILNLAKYDYVVDAIDTFTPKVLFIYYTLKNNFPLVSSMGTAGKLDPTQIKIADISETYGDKLARLLRKKLHKLGIYTGFKAVFSPEPRNLNSLIYINEKNKKTTLGTISFVPAVFGAFCAYTVINDLIHTKENKHVNISDNLTDDKPDN